jgi:uncharacterized membrane protein YobD (UPF0266 family)
MTVTDIVLVLFIAALLAYAIYDEFIMPRRHGETLLSPFCDAGAWMRLSSRVSSSFLFTITSPAMVQY